MLSEITTALLALLLTATSYAIFKAWKAAQFWKRRQIPHIKPYLFLGNAARAFFKKIQLHESHLDTCRKFPDEPLVGYFEYSDPVLVVKDVNYAEKVLIKDFSHFSDRFYAMDESDPLKMNLALISGARWHAFRTKLSPMFTSGKLKTMFEPMSICGEKLISLFAKKKEFHDFDMADIIATYSLDVSGCCIFGIDSKTLNNPDSLYYRMANKLFEIDSFMLLRYILITNAPTVAKKLGITFEIGKVTKYFSKIMKETLEYRRNNNIHRNDFVQMMIQLKDKGFIEVKTKDSADDYLNIDTAMPSKTANFEITDDIMIGAAVGFLTAGFPGLTNTILYTLYELAKNNQIQEKLREEIRQIVEEHGELNYDALTGMTYLEQCVKETLRIHPVIQILFRICIKDYTFPNGYKISAGERLMVAAKWLQKNPNIYPEPEQFNPERFNPKDSKYPSCSWLPFGQGPRGCIGIRFAMMQIKFSLATLLNNYKFQLSPKTREPIVEDPNIVLNTPKYPILFNITKV